MDSASRSSSSPSKVLAPVPPQRMNQQVPSEFQSLRSTSSQEQLKNPKAFSDVQTRVALLNSLSRGNSPASTTSSSGTNAALQRAVLGREEAESSLASVSAQLSEANSRERRISERLESLLEELHSAKERQAHERSIFEKEIRKARKEAFRASSALVKLQDELKSSKAEVKDLRDGVSSEREAKEQAEKKASERAGTVTDLTKQIEVLRGKLQSFEESNELEPSETKIHEIPEKSVSSTEYYESSGSPCKARVELRRQENTGMASLTRNNPAVTASDRKGNLKRTSELAGSPFSDSESVSDGFDITPLKKQRIWSEFVTPKEDEDTIGIESPNLRIMELRAKLQWEKKLRAEAQKTIEFMCIECQFKACRCRMAESEGREYVYDVEYDRKLKASKKEKEDAGVISNEDRHPNNSEARDCSYSSSRSGSSGESEGRKAGGNFIEAQDDLLITFSPETGTFRSVPSPIRSPEKDNRTNRLAESRPSVHQGHEDVDLLTQSPIKPEIDDQSQFERTAKVTVPIYDFASPTPPTRSAAGRKSGILLSPGDGTNEIMDRMGHSITKTVPLRAEENDATDSVAPGTPVSREAALAQIRARRGKAQGLTRCASAAEGNVNPDGDGMGVTPIRGAKRIPGLQANTKPQNDMRERRDLSAPTRLFRK